MGPILLAATGTIFLALGLEVRIRGMPPRFPPGWLLVVTGVTSLLLAYFVLTENVPPWVRVGTPLGALGGALAGRLGGPRGLGAQAGGAKNLSGRRDVANRWSAFAAAFAIGSIASAFGMLVWGVHPGPSGVLGIATLATLGGGLGAALAVRNASSTERN